MFGIEFMTGAMFFALVKLITLLVVLYIVYRIVKKIYVFLEDDSYVKTLNIKGEIITLGGIILFFTFFGSLTQPKVSIETLPNRDLIEYQQTDEDKDVVIETPAPRTETLQGFEPLKED